ncbi:MAG: hypothetical protein VYB38_04575 [Bacteroidota bacterium]|nr:hypothetical protein [Bacteroidota bacterium]
MKQFYFFNRLILVAASALVLFSCQKEDEFILTTEEIINEDNSSIQFKVPSLEDVQSNFQSKTSSSKLFQNSGTSKSSVNEDLGFSVDWENSFPTLFDPENDLAILYTPIRYNSEKRVKSFIASAEIDGDLVSQLITLAYRGAPSLDSFSGYMAYHDLNGEFITASYYEQGTKISTIYKSQEKVKTTNKNSCAQQQFAYIQEYGLDGYEYFFPGGLCSEAYIESDGSGGSSGSNNMSPPGDLSSGGGFPIPAEPGSNYGDTPVSGGGSSSTGGSSSPGGSSSSLEPESFWQESTMPNASFTTTLASNLNLNYQQTQWLNNTQNDVTTQLLPYQIYNFVQENNQSTEAKSLAKLAVPILMGDKRITFDQALTTIVINNLENQVTGDPIELYLVAKYKNRLTLELSVFSTSDRVEVGEYELTPHFDGAGKLVFYAAIRDNDRGIEFIIKANALQDFQNNLGIYTHAANLFYINGIPSEGQIAMAAGDSLVGLQNMWADAIQSPEWWAYTITSFGHLTINGKVRKFDTSVQTYPPKIIQDASLGNMIGKLREAGRRNGFFGMGTATRAESEIMGKAWVGDGFRESTSTPGIFISADGLKQYRTPKFKPNINKTQSNFQSRNVPYGDWINNGHLDIIN